MRVIFYSSLLLLAACPTPPENVPGANSNQNGQNGGGPNGGGPNGGQAPNGAGGPPPEGGAGGQPPNGAGGQPPEGGAGGQPPEGGPDAGGQPPEGGAGGQYPEGGPDASADGSGQPPEGGAGGTEGGQPPEGGPDAGGAEGENPAENVGLVEGSILIKVDQPPPTDQSQQYTQEDISAKSHITISGQATCGCSDNLLLRVTKFLAPNSKPSKDDLITTKKIDGEGAYSIIVPKDENPIAIELLVDQNGDGLPSRGERFAVVEQGGKMIPGEDLTELNLDASDRELDNQTPE